jgi:uncharacterized coiled-coil DUF342 family protein
VNQSTVEVEAAVPRDNSTLETALKAIWEKARAASDLIRQLRDEKRTLIQRVAELESHAQRQDQELRNLRAEHEDLLSSSGDNVMTADEKERLKGKIRDLIAKINSYL